MQIIKTETEETDYMWKTYVYKYCPEILLS